MLELGLRTLCALIYKYKRESKKLSKIIKHLSITKIFLLLGRSLVEIMKLANDLSACLFSKSEYIQSLKGDKL